MRDHRIFSSKIGSQCWVQLPTQKRTDFLFILAWDKASVSSFKNSNTQNLEGS